MKGKWAIWSGLAVVVALAVGAAAVACGGGSDNKSPATTQPAGTQAPAATTKLILDLDTVRGSANLPADAAIKAARSCVQASKFPLGGQVVWRIKVVDPRTGSEMDDKALATVVVKLADGQTFKASYGVHGSSAPFESFWAVTWTIPVTYPTGAVDYTVTATDKEGRTGVWNQFKVASAMLTVVPTEPLVRNDVAMDTFATR
jgi:hypothetical protein